MKKLLLGVFLALSGSLFSQFEAQLSQYMLNNNVFNPAAAGQSNLIDVFGIFRLNMYSISGGGSTKILNINSPLKIGKKNQGIGFNFMRDDVGWFTNQSANFDYAYKVNIADGSLSIGAELGFVSLGFAGDSVNKHKITLGTYHISGDDAIPLTKVVGTSFDLGVGLWYSTDSWYSGVSYRHLNNPTVKWGQNTEFRQPSLLFATGGFSKKLDNPKYILKPSVLLKSDFTTIQIDLSSLLEYNDKYWGGLSLRPLNSVVFMAGLNIEGGLSLGYAFDLPTSKLISTSYGSHELTLSYSFEYVFSKQSSRYKSIRYL